MYFPKPLGTQNGEVLKDKTKELPVKGKKKTKQKQERLRLGYILQSKCVSAHQK